MTSEHFTAHRTFGSIDVHAGFFYKGWLEKSQFSRVTKMVAVELVLGTSQYHSHLVAEITQLMHHLFLRGANVNNGNGCMLWPEGIGAAERYRLVYQMVFFPKARKFFYSINLRAKLQINLRAI